MVSNPLGIRLFGVDFANPIFSASGTFGYGRDYADFIAPNEIGAVVTKGTSIVEWIGNPGTRVYETPAGMLNSIGLQNPGIDHFLQEDLPWLRQQNAKVIVNVAGRTAEDYLQVVEKCQKHSGIHALEINISCPNVKQGGMAFGTIPEVAHELLKHLKQNSDIPLIAKLSPNVTDIVTIAQAVEDAGVDAVSMINTLTGMAIDTEKMKPALGNKFGGLSGPAIRPVAVRMVYQVSQKINIPIIGIGGIWNAHDALEFFLAGASAVQVGTVMFVNPHAPQEIMSGIKEYLARKGFDRIEEIVGLAWKGQ